MQRRIDVGLDEAQSPEALAKVRQAILTHVEETKGRSLFQVAIISYWYVFDYDQLPLYFTTSVDCKGQCEDDVELPSTVSVYW